MSKRPPTGSWDGQGGPPSKKSKGGPRLTSANGSLVPNSGYSSSSYTSTSSTSTSTSYTAHAMPNMPSMISAGSNSQIKIYGSPTFTTVHGSYTTYNNTSEVYNVNSNNVIGNVYLEAQGNLHISRGDGSGDALDDVSRYTQSEGERVRAKYGITNGQQLQIGGGGANDGSMVLANQQGPPNPSGPINNNQSANFASDFQRALANSIERNERQEATMMNAVAGKSMSSGTQQQQPLQILNGANPNTLALPSSLPGTVTSTVTQTRTQTQTIHRTVNTPFSQMSATYQPGQVKGMSKKMEALFDMMMKVADEDENGEPDEAWVQELMGGMGMVRGMCGNMGIGMSPVMGANQMIGGGSAGMGMVQGFSSSNANTNTNTNLISTGVISSANMQSGYVKPLNAGIMQAARDHAQNTAHTLFQDAVADIVGAGQASGVGASGPGSGGARGPVGWVGPTPPAINVVDADADASYDAEDYPQERIGRSRQIEAAPSISSSVSSASSSRSNSMSKSGRSDATSMTSVSGHSESQLTVAVKSGKGKGKEKGLTADCQSKSKKSKISGLSDNFSKLSLSSSSSTGKDAGGSDRNLLRRMRDLVIRDKPRKVNKKVIESDSEPEGASRESGDESEDHGRRRAHRASGSGDDSYNDDSEEYSNEEDEPSTNSSNIPHAHDSASPAAQATQLAQGAEAYATAMSDSVGSYLKSNITYHASQPSNTTVTQSHTQDGNGNTLTHTHLHVNVPRTQTTKNTIMYGPPTAKTVMAKGGAESGYDSDSVHAALPPALANLNGQVYIAPGAVITSSHFEGHFTQVNNVTNVRNEGISGVVVGNVAEYIQGAEERGMSGANANRRKGKARNRA